MVGWNPASELALFNQWAWRAAVCLAVSKKVFVAHPPRRSATGTHLGSFPSIALQI